MTNPDWFAFETRIRKLLVQMIEPISKRSINDKEIIAEMKKANDLVRKKVDECEFVIHKT